MLWRFINTNYNDAAYNMAVDEALLESCQRGDSPPVFRTYGWQPPGVSFGYTQDPALEFNLEACRERGVDIVRRLTGGRAVYHHKEVTYSVVAPENDPTIGGSIHEAYMAINQGLAAGLARLGIYSDLEKSKFEPDREKIKSPCFTAAARYELTFDSRKLVGSAQRKINTMILQHGSILLEGHQEEMVELTNFDAERRERLLTYLRRKTTSLLEISGRHIHFDQVVEALRVGFAEHFGLTFQVDHLTTTEQTRVNELIASKYRSDHWNFKPRRFQKQENLAPELHANSA